MGKENEINDGDNPFEGFDLSELGDFTQMIEDSTGDGSETDTDKGEDEPDVLKDGEIVIDDNDIDSISDGDDKDKTDDKIEDPSSQVTDPKSSPLTPYAKLLVEEGVLQDFDLEKYDGSADGLVDAFKNQVQKHVEDYKESLDPRAKWLLDNMEEGVPLQQLLKIDEERVTLSSLKPEVLKEDIDLQKQLAKAYYKKTTNWTDAKIEKEVTRLETLGELAEEVLPFFEELKVLNSKEEEKAVADAKKQAADAEKARQETLTTFKAKLESTKEIIPGTVVSAQVKDRIFKVLTTPVATDQSGTPLNAIAKARAENPLEFEMNLAYIFEITKGFKDWSALVATGKKKAIQEFEQAAGRLDIKGGSTNPSKNPRLDGTAEGTLNAMGIFGK